MLTRGGLWLVERELLGVSVEVVVAKVEETVVGGDVGVVGAAN